MLGRGHFESDFAIEMILKSFDASQVSAVNRLNAFRTTTHRGFSQKLGRDHGPVPGGTMKNTANYPDDVCEVV